MSKNNIFDMLEENTELWEDTECFASETKTDRVLEKVRSAVEDGSAKPKKPVRHRFIYVLAAALVSSAAIVGTFAVYAQIDNNKTASEHSAEAVQQTEDLQPAFRAVSHGMKDKYVQLTDVVIELNNEATRRIIMEEEGIDIYAYDRGEVKSSKNFSEDNIDKLAGKITRVANIDYIRKLNELMAKIASDGYGDPKWVPSDDEDIVMCEDDNPRFCNLVVMCINAYNDPDYELSDVERYRLTNFFENAYSQFITVKFCKIGDPERIDQVMNYINQTIYAEYERKALIG